MNRSPQIPPRRGRGRTSIAPAAIGVVLVMLLLVQCSVAAVRLSPDRGTVRVIPPVPSADPPPPVAAPATVLPLPATTDPAPSPAARAPDADRPVRTSTAKPTPPREKPRSRPSRSRIAAPVPEPDRAVYYPNCAAARSAGAAPLRAGQPGYRAVLDVDRDGLACEWE